MSGSDEAAGIVDASLAHLDTAYNLARWLTGSDHDAEDMVQEAYLRALAPLERIAGGRPVVDFDDRSQRLLRSPSASENRAIR